MFNTILPPCISSFSQSRVNLYWERGTSSAPPGAARAYIGRTEVQKKKKRGKTLKILNFRRTWIVTISNCTLWQSCKDRLPLVINSLWDRLWRASMCSKELGVHSPALDIGGRRWGESTGRDPWSSRKLGHWVQNRLKRGSEIESRMRKDEGEMIICLN